MDTANTKRIVRGHIRNHDSKQELCNRGILAIAFLFLFLFLFLSVVFRSEAQPRIVGGNAAPEGAYPWMVALVYDSAPDNLSGLACGGTLISEEWVITAAHCINEHRFSHLQIVTGSTVLTDATEVRRIERVYRHPQYNSRTLHHDIALLKLQSPIELPSVPSLPEYNADYQTDSIARAIGWGMVGTQSPVSNILLQANLFLSSAVDCQTFTGVPGYQVICAKPSPRDATTCFGDSGGPLLSIDEVSQGYELSGITSFTTSRCNSNGYELPTGGYTRVSYYRPWIDYVMQDTAVTEPTLSDTCVENRCALSLTSPNEDTATPAHVTWRFASGETATGSFVQHVFDQIGEQIVIVDVMDNTGLFTRYEHTVNPQRFESNLVNQERFTGTTNGEPVIFRLGYDPINLHYDALSARISLHSGDRLEMDLEVLGYVQYLSSESGAHGEWRVVARRSTSGGPEQIEVPLNWYSAYAVVAVPANSDSTGAFLVSVNYMK